MAAIAAIAFSNASRVSTCDGRVSSSTRRIASSPATTAACGLPGWFAGNLVQPRRADAEEVERGRHRVRGEVAAARAGARARDALERVHLAVGDRAGGVRADRLEDVLDRDVGAAVPARLDRAAVEHEPRQVEPRERHHARGDRLVAADDADETVEQMPARDELDRVGDHLARDERRAHADRAHRDAVGDGDRVELDRRPAGAADALLDVAREPPVVQVARHRLDPRRRDADQRLREVGVGEPDALEHRARRRAVDAVGERGAVALGGVRLAVGRGH